MNMIPVQRPNFFDQLLTNRIHFVFVTDVEYEMDTIGQKLVEEIRSLNWDHIHKGMKVTASVGLSMWSKGDSLDNAVRIADDMLYDVKHHGRDNWRSWPLDEAA